MYAHFLWISVKMSIKNFAPEYNSLAPLGTINENL